jgi:uncharacterized glyoxalase superfamily protein PhnB
MNGSVLIPSLRYKDAPAAIAWLEQAFGFERHAVYEGPDGTVAHAELRFGNGLVMLGSASNESPLRRLYVTPAEIGGRVTSPLYLIVKDCEQAYARALAAKAEIIVGIRTMESMVERHSRSGILKATFGLWASILPGRRKKLSPPKTMQRCAVRFAF